MTQRVILAIAPERDTCRVKFMITVPFTGSTAARCHCCCLSAITKPPHLLITPNLTAGSTSVPGWSTTSTVTLLLCRRARSAAMLMAYNTTEQHPRLVRLGQIECICEGAHSHSPQQQGHPAHPLSAEACCLLFVVHAQDNHKHMRTRCADRCQGRRAVQQEH